MFESDFLSSGQQNKDRYRQLISQAAEIICASLPAGPYNGKNGTELAALVSPDFLPALACPQEQIAEILRVAVSNSVSLSHANTAAHLHCPPVLAALAAEVVISALNQSMDSFDQAPMA
ncbi:MAG TPA: hypothetical protein VGK96_23195, partial [Candidatus Sulfotelmatobacter sp.]